MGLRLYSVLLTVTILEMAILPVVRGAFKVRMEDLEGRTRYNVLKRSEETETIISQLNLGDDVELEMVDSLTSVQGTTKRKYREIYKGLRVYNTGLDVEQQGRGIGVIIESDVYRNIADDLEGKENCNLTVDQAENITLKSDVQMYESRNIVYIDKGNTAHYVIHVQLSINTQDEDLRYHAFVDKCSQEVLGIDRLDGVCESPRNKSTGQTEPPPCHMESLTVPYPADQCGPFENCDIKQQGGNPDRKFQYGSDRFCLRLKTSTDGNTCILENEYIKRILSKAILYSIVVDLNCTDDSKTDVVIFPCSDGYNDEVNGGYSPTFDIFFFATKTLEMYREYYGDDALPNEISYAKSHYRVNYANAFWNRKDLIFGDGDKSKYPFGVIDVVAHELGHAVVGRASELEYWKQSGGMNEAFADMFGEVAEEYVFGSSDWGCGYDVVKKEGKANRYFEDPTRDNRSIKHVDSYTRCLNVHYSSGVYNHAFWQLAHVRGLGLRAAFECFVTANRLYWRATSTFEEGACDVIRGAYDRGYDIDLVADSFREVGIKFENCCNFSQLVTAELTPGTWQKDLHVSKLRQPLFKIHVPYDKASVIILASRRIEIAISQSYQRSSKPIKTGSGIVAAWVNSSEDVYVRFFLDPSSPIDEIADVTALLIFLK